MCNFCTFFLLTMSYCRFVITIYRNWKPLYDNLNHTKILSENELIVISYITVKQKGTNTWSKSINQKKITLDKTEREIKNEQSTDKGNIRHIRHRAMTNKWQIRVITKLPNTEQSSKGKGKTHKSTNRQNQSTTGKQGKPQLALTWYRHFQKNCVLNQILHNTKLILRWT